MSREEAIVQLLFERNEAGLRFFEQKYKNLCLNLISLLVFVFIIIMKDDAQYG